MKMPKLPPNIKLITNSLNHTQFWDIFKLSRFASSEKYYHWDEVRHRIPPKRLTHEQWWLGIKLDRMQRMKSLPLCDQKNKAFTFGLPDPALELLHYLAREASGQILVEDRNIATDDMKERYVIRSLMEEAITSSQLEGAVTTRQIAKQMLRTRRTPQNKSERMILNNYNAMKRIQEIKNKPLTPETLFELHVILTKDTLENPSVVGRFRTANEHINVGDDYNQVFYEPPPADQLKDRIARMCDFANGKTPAYFIDPAVRAIILHFWLAYEHPFIDGNGRCARALFYWSMLRQGYWMCEFISISEIIKKNYAQYGMSFLYTETDDNDLTYFILYNLEVIKKAIENLQRYVRTKTEDIRRTEKLLRASSGLNHRQLALLSHALRHPDAEYSVKSHQTSHNVVIQTARNDLYNLLKRGLLTEKKIGRTFYYYPTENLGEKLKHI